MIGRLLRTLWRGITLLRLALANLLFIALLILVFLTLRGGSPEPLPDSAALLLNPAGRVVDQRSRVEALALLGETDSAGGEVLLRDLVDAVDFARKDARISALVLELDDLLYIGQSKTLELAAALQRFRDSGKAIVATGDYYSQDQYRLAVEADTILMHPLGAVAVEGYASYVNYFAEALDKLSVTMHVFRAGENKSLAEPFLRRDMSPGEKAVTARWLQQLWGNYTRDVEARRGLPTGAVDALINEYPRRLEEAGGDPAALALSAGLVDELLHRPQRDAWLRALVGAGEGDETYAAIPFDAYLSRMRPLRLGDGAAHIAVVTAQGNMLPGEQGPGSIGGDSLVQLLARAASRPGVEALVLRVNSGGGSVFAAEVIRAELEKIRSRGLPVVVSMGAVAASGGYYIATAADRIFATPATLTGSIGVIALFPTAERLLARAGIGTDGVATTTYAGGLRPDRALAPELAAALQLSVDKLHRDFIKLVADSRDLDIDSVSRFADGRVLAAGDAQSLGLVDGIGGLEQAIEEAARLAGTSDYRVIDVEPPLSPRELLLQRVARLTGGAVGAGQALPRSPVLRGWLQSWAQGYEVLETLGDPQHLYMRCLQCPP
jgi:protease-4